jgi:hypothetical protein
MNMFLYLNIHNPCIPHALFQKSTEKIAHCRLASNFLWLLKKAHGVLAHRNAPCILQILVFKAQDEKLTREYKACSAQVADAANKLAAMKKANALDCAQLRELRAQTAREDVRIQSVE